MTDPRIGGHVQINNSGTARYWRTVPGESYLVTGKCYMGYHILIGSSTRCIASHVLTFTDNPSPETETENTKMATATITTLNLDQPVTLDQYTRALQGLWDGIIAGGRTHDWYQPRATFRRTTREFPERGATVHVDPIPVDLTPEMFTPGGYDQYLNLINLKYAQRLKDIKGRMLTLTANSGYTIEQINEVLTAGGLPVHEVPTPPPGRRYQGALPAIQVWSEAGSRRDVATEIRDALAEFINEKGWTIVPGYEGRPNSVDEIRNEYQVPAGDMTPLL